MSILSCIKACLNIIAIVRQQFNCSVKHFNLSIFFSYKEGNIRDLAIQATTGELTEGYQFMQYTPRQQRKVVNCPRQTVTISFYWRKIFFQNFISRTDLPVKITETRQTWEHAKRPLRYLNSMAEKRQEHYLIHAGINGFEWSIQGKKEKFKRWKEKMHTSTNYIHALSLLMD